MSVYHNDVPQWLVQAVNSISRQTYGHFVFLIVIDGEVSKHISDILFELANRDERVFLARNTYNAGLAASMNFAIEWGLDKKFQYFFRMDADDISVNERLEKQIEYLSTHHRVSVLGTALTEINETGDKVGARVMPAFHKQILKVLPRRCSLNHPTVAFRYEIFMKGFRYDDSLMNTQDYFLWIKLAKEGVVFGNLKDRLLDFRRVNDFYKRRGLSKSLNEFRARLYAMRALKKMTLWNLLYACGVLVMRLMPAKLVKLAYKLDRKILERSDRQ
ncbi:glycosyltransferase [Aestuariibacter sp. A3R04]|nr:glycosyltransferase [Aestuariibacter sp. A3R04]MBU3022097.1 glycosyltransferase [Aestuariibacter sp. A3R04]